MCVVVLCFFVELLWFDLPFCDICFALSSLDVMFVLRCFVFIGSDLLCGGFASH